MCRENIRPTYGVLRPRPPPVPTYLPDHRVGVAVGAFIAGNPPSAPIIYINSHEESIPYLNAPVDIRFTVEYWESV